MADKAHLHNDGRLLDHIEHIERSADSGHMVMFPAFGSMYLECKKRERHYRLHFDEARVGLFRCDLATNSHAG